MKLSGSWRVLLDCSTFLSGAYYPFGKPRTILRLWEEEVIDILMTDSIFGEYERKIKPVGLRMRKELPSAQYYLNLLRSKAIFIKEQEVDPKLCRDPGDIKYLEAAKGGNIDFLISSDKDLLAVKKFGKTKIVSPDQFLKQVLE